MEQNSPPENYCSSSGVDNPNFQVDFNSLTIQNMEGDPGGSTPTIPYSLRDDAITPKPNLKVDFGGVTIHTIDNESTVPDQASNSDKESQISDILPEEPANINEIRTSTSQVNEPFETHLQIDFGGQSIHDLADLPEHIEQKILDFNKEILEDCLASLLFVEDGHQFDHTKISQYEILDVPKFINWVTGLFRSARALTIKFPITTVKEASYAWKCMDKFKSIRSNLEEPPTISPSEKRLEFAKAFEQELLTLSNFVLQKMLILRFNLSCYNITMDKIKQKRVTRQFASIIDGSKPIPANLIFELNKFDLTSKPYPIIINDTENDQFDFNFVTREANQVSPFPMTIESPEPTAHENDELNSVIQILIGKETIQQSHPLDLEESLQIIEEKFGIILESDDPNLLQTLNNIITSQTMLTNIVQNSEGELSSSVTELTNFLPNYQSTPKDSNSNTNFIENQPNFSIFKDPSIESPNVNLQALCKDNVVTLTDSVECIRDDKQSSTKNNSLTDHSESPKGFTEHIKQDLGEILFPLVHKICPSSSKKVTGMLLDLPNKEIMEIINSESMLTKHINEAIATLIKYNQKSLTTEITKKVPAPENDYQHAVFQVVSSGGQQLYPSPSYVSSTSQRPNVHYQPSLINNAVVYNPALPYIRQPSPSIENTNSIPLYNNQQLQYVPYHSQPQGNINPIYSQSQPKIQSILPSVPMPTGNTVPYISPFQYETQPSQPLVHINPTYSRSLPFQKEIQTSQPLGNINSIPSQKVFNVQSTFPPEHNSAYFSNPATMPNNQSHPTVLNWTNSTNAVNLNSDLYSQKLIKNPKQTAATTQYLHQTNPQKSLFNQVQQPSPTQPHLYSQAVSNSTYNPPPMQTQPMYWSNTNLVKDNMLNNPNLHTKPKNTTNILNSHVLAAADKDHPNFNKSTYNNYKHDNPNPINHSSKDIEPPIVLLAKRESRELASTCFLVNRTIDQLTQSQNMDNQQLVDLLNNMSSHTKVLEKLENKVSSFHKNLIMNQQIIKTYNDSLYQNMLTEVTNAEDLSVILQQKLFDADAVLKNEKITTSRLSNYESKELPYKEFSGGKGMSDLHIFEFLNILNTNFKIARTTENIKAQIVKKLLKGAAKLAIPDDIVSFTEIKSILISRFGNPIVILADIMELHKNVGKIPSRYCQRPPWHKIEESARYHLLLIRKAEQLSANPMAIPEIFSSGTRNFNLIKLISHEYNEDLKSAINTTDERTMYRLIVQRFEQILASAASNIDHLDSKKKEIPDKKNHEVFDPDQYALAYDKKSYEITVGKCLPEDCHFCDIMQTSGIGGRYFEDHLLFGPSKIHYVNNCPNYLSLTIQDRNALIKDNKICPFCLKFQVACKNPKCGSKHDIPHPSGKPKSYVCISKGCKNRIELCMEHEDINQTVLDQYKRNNQKRLNPNSTVAAFTTACNPITYKFNSFKGNIKTTVINDNRIDPNNTNVLNYNDTLSSTTKVENWLHDNDYNIQSSIKTGNNASGRNSPVSLTPGLKELDSHTDDLQNQYETFKQLNNELVDHPVMLSVQQSSSHKLNMNNNDKPLMLESTNDLLNRTDGMLLADNAKSIFIYSKLEGLTRPLSCLFDSGGGSSLTLNNVPGRQLYATKKNNKPVCLQGIGSGSTMGQEFIMSLPLLKGGSVAVNIYSVPEILRPMSRIDLEPALKFIKSKSQRDNKLDKSLKDEIAKASIYRYIEGSLDLLLGVKLYGVFPTLVHTLSCGLSIFKMKLKPSSESTLYCLGGPWQHLDNIKHIFPDGAIMLQSINNELSTWRESSQSIIGYHLGFPNSHIETNHLETTNIDNTILMINEETPSTSLHALNHLNACNNITPGFKDYSPNIYIVLKCDDKFKKDISMFQSFFSGYYPHFKESLINPNHTYIPLIALHIDKKRDMYKTGIVFAAAVNEWVINSQLFNNSFDISFKGIKSIKDRKLFMKPDIGAQILNSLKESLLYSFIKAGFICHPQFLPQLMFADLKYKSNIVATMMEQFSNITIGSSTFNQIHMIEIKHQSTDKCLLPVKTLPLVYDNTLFIKPQSSSQSTQTNLPNQFQSESQSTQSNSSNPLQSTSQDTQTNPHNPSRPNNLLDYPKYLNTSKQWDQNIGQEIIPIAQMLEPEEPQLTDRDILLFQETHPDNMVCFDANINDKHQSNSLQKNKQREFNDLIIDLRTILQSNEPAPKCMSCLQCKECKLLLLSCNDKVSRKEHYEEMQMKESVTYDPVIGKFIAPLPLKDDPDVALMSNDEESKNHYYKMVASLQDKPAEKETVLNSFNKLIELNYIQKLSNMDKEIQSQVMNKQRYVIPWNIVYKQSSISTPCRIVLNASAKTKTKKSLNTILCKGVPKLNMLPLTLAMVIDPILVTADLQKFYNSCLIPSSQYHLQCVWWNESLDPKSEPELYILTTHFYGLASSGRILEICLDKVAEMHKDNEIFYNTIKNKTYVDDLFCNVKTTEQAAQIISDCDTILNKMGFKVKGFAESYKRPNDSISEQAGMHRSVSVLGMTWKPETDTLQYKVPNLDLTSIKRRGKIFSNNFTGNTLEEFDKFVPPKITLRMVASKAASLYDPIGFLQPWYLGLKHLLRISCMATERQWDQTLSDDLRNMWVSKLWEMHCLSNIEFPRCSLPSNTTDDKLTVVGISDYGLIGRLQAFYALRKTTDKYHVQLIYAKSHLTNNKSVPCEELMSLNSCAEYLNKICLALTNVSKRILITDSTVCLWWLSKNLFDLAPFQRRRVQNILSYCDPEDIYHIRSKLNTSDIGTKKPEPLSCILPDSQFHKGPACLTKGIKICEAEGYLKNIRNVVLDPALKPLAQDGIPFHSLSLQIKPQTNPTTTEANFSQETTITAFRPIFVHKVKERLEFSQYLVNPIEKPWGTSVKIMSIVINFANKIIKKINAKISSKLEKSNLNKCIKLLTVPSELKESSSYLCLFNLAKDLEVNNNLPTTLLSSVDTPKTYNLMFESPQEMSAAKEKAVMYFLKIASMELHKFYTPSMLKKHTIYHDGIYYSRQRVLETSQVSDIMGSEIQIKELGINQQVPCSDRHSPTGISILMHYHRKICNHSGVDRTWLKCLESIFVFQGQALMMDIVKGCFHCRRKLLKTIQTCFGPINKFSLTFAAVNRHVMLDISGPFLLKTKLNAKATRSNSNMVKIYLLHTVCLTSFLNSVAIVEAYDSQSFLDALHRIGSRFGYPTTAWTDSSSSQIKALLGMNITMSSMFGTIFQETGIQICVSGAGSSSHSRQGRVEKSIHCLQQYLKNKKVHVENLTVLQFDSLVSQAAAFLNSMPLCTKSKHNGMISSSLISPFSFLLGRRSNMRAPASYPTLHNSRGEILDKVALASEGMFRYFTAAIPDLLLRPTSYQSGKTEVQENDTVLFRYEESPMAVIHKLGLITKLEYDSDGISRIAEIKYCLSQEQSLPINNVDNTQVNQNCRFTRRGIHTIVKIYSACDADINTDIDLINREMQDLNIMSINQTKNPILEFEPIELNTNTPIDLVTAQLGYLIRKC